MHFIYFLAVKCFALFASPALELDDEEMRGGADSDFGPRGRPSVKLQNVLNSFVPWRRIDMRQTVEGHLCACATAQRFTPPGQWGYVVNCDSKSICRQAWAVDDSGGRGRAGSIRGGNSWVNLLCAVPSCTLLWVFSLGKTQSGGVRDQLFL